MPLKRRPPKYTRGYYPGIETFMLANRSGDLERLSALGDSVAQRESHR
jgi:hypothetical protein